MKNKVYGKEYFEAKQQTDEFYPPDDIRFEVYSSEIWKIFLDNLQNKDMPIMDFGCGRGTALHVLEKLGYTNLYGIDYRSAVPEDFVKNFKFYCEDIFASSLKPEQFEALISSMVIEHVPEKEFVDEIYRVLKPNGIALVTSVLKGKFAWYFYKNKLGKVAVHPDHVREYKSTEEFAELFKEKFEIIKVTKATLRFPLFDPLFKFLSNRKPFYFLKDAITKNKILKNIRLLRVPIPNYYAVEIVIRKKL